MKQSLYWHEYTWTDLQKKKPEVVLLPVGSVEAHGPHLPLATDSIISDQMAARAAKQLNEQAVYTLILPSVHYVVTDFSRDFPGTISVSKHSFELLLRDIAASLAAHSIQLLCVVNSHLEPDHLATIHNFAASCTNPRVVFPDKTRKPWGSLLTEEFKKGACHAGSYETSLVLAAREELVRDERLQLPPNETDLAQLMKSGIRTFRDAGADRAYFGNPASASIDEGEQIYAILTRMIIETVLEARRTLESPGN